MAQWYAKVPADANVKENELPAVTTCESHAPVSEVEVWLKGSRLVHVTVSPARTVTVGGANAVFWMFTALVAAIATSGSTRERGPRPARPRRASWPYFTARAVPDC